MQRLEFLPKMRGVEQLHKRQLTLAKVRGFSGNGRRDHLTGVMNKKGLLGFDARRLESIRLKGFGQPVPTNMAGEILFPRSGQQVVGLSMAIVGAGGADRGRLNQFSPGFAIVEGEKQAVPGLGGDRGRKFAGGERQIKCVSVPRRLGEQCEHVAWHVLRRDFSERLGLQFHHQFGPLVLAEDKATERLRVEKLVRKNHAVAREVKRFAQAHGADLSKRVRYPSQHARFRLCPNFNPGVR